MKVVYIMMSGSPIAPASLRVYLTDGRTNCNGGRDMAASYTMPGRQLLISQRSACVYNILLYLRRSSGCDADTAPQLHPKW